jgi:hypothetical protein
MPDADKRVDTIHDLPDESLRCAALGRHVGFGAEDPQIAASPGWGPRVNAVQVKYTCDCGRWKTQDIDLDTGELLSRSVQYGGGVLLWGGGHPSKADAVAVYLARVLQRRAGTGVLGRGGVA